MQKIFARNLASLEEIFSFLQHCGETYAIARERKNALTFAVEEFFTNMVKYNPQSTGDIILRLEPRRHALEVELIDTDADRFDVTQTPDPDLTLPLSQRSQGGLGIFLSRNLVDSLTYTYENRRSIIHFTIALGNAYAKD